MKRLNHKLIFALIALLGIGIFWPRAVEASGYTIIKLQSRFGSTQSAVMDLNDFNVLLGWSVTDGNPQYAILDLDTSKPATPIMQAKSANHINRKGMILGMATTTDGTRSFGAYWIKASADPNELPSPMAALNSTGNMVGLKTLLFLHPTPHTLSLATGTARFTATADINDNNISVGFRHFQEGDRDMPAKWDKKGNSLALDLPTGVGGRAIAINNAGDVLVQTYLLDHSKPDSAVLIDNSGTSHTIGTFGYTTSPRGLNDYGVVVGSSDTRAGKTLPFVWDQKSGMRRLPLPGDAAWGSAAVINNSGVIAGSYVDTTSLQHAIVWMPK